VHEGTPFDLSMYRLNKAKEKLEAAIIMKDKSMFEDAANRSYYAIFHATRALLALEMKDFKKHSGVISYFQKNYVKTRIFDVKYSEIITSAFDIRNDSDYEDFFIINKEDVENQINDAKMFLEAVEKYIISQKK
jgi:uncharacterized protein (UPF0332 family)